VEAGHHLIVAHDVVMTGSDRRQLAAMAGKAKGAVGVEALDVLADEGYFSGRLSLPSRRPASTPHDHR
jgi:transposase